MKQMTIRELCDKTELTPVSLPQGDREIEGVYCGDLLSWVMGKAEAGNAWITIMSNINVIAVASLCDVSCVILAEGARLDEDAENAAKAKDINVLSSEKSAYELAVMLKEVL